MGARVRADLEAALLQGHDLIAVETVRQTLTRVVGDPVVDDTAAGLALWDLRATTHGPGPGAR